MKQLSASDARVDLLKLIDHAAESHEPIRITGQSNSAILISESDWSSIQETLFLLSVPGMRESMRQGMDASADACSTKIEW